MNTPIQGSYVTNNHIYIESTDTKIVSSQSSLKKANEKKRKLDDTTNEQSSKIFKGDLSIYSTVDAKGFQKKSEDTWGFNGVQGKVDLEKYQVFIPRVILKRSEEFIPEILQEYFPNEVCLDIKPFGPMENLFCYKDQNGKVDHFLYTYDAEIPGELKDLYNRKNIVKNGTFIPIKVRILY